MTFPSLEALLQRFHALGARTVLCKMLAENDNSKQQIYLGKDFSALNVLPFGEITTDSHAKQPTFKAKLAFRWIDAHGHEETASGAQLILYPGYPEVRLSGFLRGCSIAPSADLRPIPKHLRTHNNASDGRLLFLAFGDEGVVYAYLALAQSAIAKSFAINKDAGAYAEDGVLLEVPTARRSAKDLLLDELRSIHKQGWHPGMRLTKHGQRVPYSAPNAAGYTLEALLGIIPNGRAEPDFHGWELKAHSHGGRITLMTPEPDGGFYGDKGVEEFLHKYGRRTDDDSLYFTGQHKVNTPCAQTAMTLQLQGYEPTTQKITSTAGGIELVSATGVITARWSYARLIQHWGRKHASAAFVPYSTRTQSTKEFLFESPVSLAEGTDFLLYLAALHQGAVVFDPAPKLSGLSTGNTSVKARSQFRVTAAKLSTLYKSFEQKPL
jgi:hypothetical protein